jgi:hypothetical protein
MVLWSALAVMGIWSVSMLPTNAVLADGSSQVAGLQAQIHQVGIEESVVAAWRSGRAPSDRAPVPQWVARWVLQFPLIPFDIPQSRVIYAIKNVAPAAASRLWAMNGSGYGEGVQLQFDMLRDGLKSAEHPHFRRPDLSRVLLAIAKFTFAQTAIFAVVNWSLLALSAAVLRRKTRRDPLLA